MIDADYLAQLLSSPGSGGMCRDVAVDQTTSSMLDHDEYVEHTRTRRDGEAEITGEESLGVQTQESGPSPLGRPGGRRGMYLRTVRAETWMPSFSSNSLAMRSSPQRGFSVAMRRINPCSWGGIAGRLGRQFTRHSSFQALRCQPSRVLGRTTTKASRQSKSFDNRVSRTRVTGSMRRGLTPRSIYRARCRPRTKIPGLDRTSRAQRQPQPQQGVTNQGE